MGEIPMCAFAGFVTKADLDANCARFLDMVKHTYSSIEFSELDTSNQSETAQVMNLLSESFAEFPNRTRYSVSRFQEELSSHWYKTFNTVAKIDDMVVGCGFARENPGCSNSFVLYLQAVARGYRGVGIGSALVANRLRMIAEYRQDSDTGYTSIQVSTKHPNRYSEHGFIPSEHFPTPRGLVFTLKLTLINR
jgi:predicted N-acetyltransferase YhbS